MNFLAHAFLSPNDDEWMVGNLLGDFVKGRKQLDQLPQNIQKGVLLHRKIDEFTDTHPLVKKGVQRLRPHHDRYAAVVIDILYDYFLAKNWSTYSSISINDFSQSVYKALEPQLIHFPPKVIRQFQTMINSNWLVQYQDTERLQWVFERLEKRVRFEANFKNAVRNMQHSEAAFDEEFNGFFPAVLNFKHQQLRYLEKPA